ncbi:hypothetical protein M446_5310 [Methylobacterium sp. 4-46]|uniref:hypothetical protein n=1 Tax=unclassified Methylobacterium TaxID=2615210 RepID=UPI000165CBD5|nr:MULTISPECIES: hypothetical protein [Methylobacterium]ACA19631.1 hypothetical protein M446_5310 [Methylobacterium sp. 4-46]WFT78827.1 hypothetical protein QA634_26720 [Methylobacterium nodulans]
MKLMNRRTTLVLSLLGAAMLAQATETPQKSREQAPNMPAPAQTLPERVRPADPGTTGTTAPRPADPDHTAPSNAGAQRT